MTRFGRIWLGALVCVVGVGLASSRAADPKYLPSDTEIVISINVKQMFESDLAKKNKDGVDQVKALIEMGLPADNPIAKYLKEMEFDPFKDLHSITVAIGGAINTENGFILIEGNFNSDKFNQVTEAAAKDNADAVRITKAGNFKVLEVTPPGDNQRLFASLTSKNMLIVAGTKDGMTDALGRVSGAKKNNLKKEVLSLLETTSSKQSVSFVSTGPAFTKLIAALPIPPAQLKQAEAFADMVKDNVDGLSVAVTLAKDIQLMLGVNAKDKEAAKSMAEQAQKGLDGLRFILQLQAQGNDQLAPVMEVLKTLKINAQGSNLIITARVTPEVIGNLMKLVPGNE